MKVILPIFMLLTSSLLFSIQLYTDVTDTFLLAAYCATVIKLAAVISFCFMDAKHDY